MGRAAPALAAALALAACVSSGGQTGVGAREAGATADMGVAGSYMLGAPYQRGGATVTPAESFTYRDLGYAEVLGSDSHPTANGGQYDPDALMGAHPTLQLPSMVLVTNVTTGRSVAVMVNDRGPSQASHIIGVSPRAAELAEIAPDGSTPVEIAVLTAPSVALANRAGRSVTPEGTELAQAPGEAPPPLPAVPAAPVQAAALIAPEPVVPPPLLQADEPPTPEAEAPAETALLPIATPVPEPVAPPAPLPVPVAATPPPAAAHAPAPVPPPAPAPAPAPAPQASDADLPPGTYAA
ncbi:MAG: hypothetical protein KDA64_13455, partial [Rhodospirillaceae bacterium]|nr:hypothetical protein [Rhodospirillaceae bacterium]